MTAAWALLALAAALIAANAVFVAAETALVTVDRGTVERAAAGEAGRAGSRRAGMVAGALRQLSTYLSGAQLGITVTSLAVGLVAEPSAARLLLGPVQALGLGEDVAETVAIAVALLGATVVQMVFGELVPKNLALSRPLSTATAVVAPLVWFTRATRPVIATLNGAANRLLRAFGVSPVEELRSARTPDELGYVVRRAGAKGTLGGRTAALLERSLVFGDRTAQDVMTPRVRMRTVTADAPVAAVIAATQATGHSRFPVVADGPDAVVGLVHVKAAISVPFEQRNSVSVAEVAAPAVLVPDTMRLDPLLDLLQDRGLQLAVVVDEYGGTAGLVTLEDLVEELIGDVVDEHDLSAPGVEPQPGGGWLLSGLLRPDEVRAATGLPLPDGDFETLAGLILTHLARLPDPGDQVTLAGVTLVVDRMSGHRIDRVRADPRPDPDSDPAPVEPQRPRSSGDRPASPGQDQG